MVHGSGRLEEVFEAGDWEAYGIRPPCRLLVVTMTYLCQSLSANLPASSASICQACTSKLTGDTGKLFFGDRESYRKGRAEILGSVLTLTMEQEWTRNDTWTDGVGMEFHAEYEWLYVLGTAGKPQGLPILMQTLAGERDVNNRGRQPRHFLSVINAHILELAVKNKLPQVA